MGNAIGIGGREEDAMSEAMHVLSSYGGVLLFVAALIEQSGVPVPAAPFLLAAGALAAAGQISLVAAVAWTALACLAADAFWFYAGHRGKDRLVPFFARLRGGRPARQPATGVRKTLRALRILTIAKFLPLGTLVPLRAGTLDISPVRFLLLDLPAALIYASSYLLLGFWFHRQLNELMAIVRGLGSAGLLLVLLLAGVYAVLGLARGHRAPIHSAENAEAANPDIPEPIKS